MWVDALYILQDNNHREDWENECAKMAVIYEGSYVTIAATRAADCNAGCLPSLPALQPLRYAIRGTDNLHKTTYLRDPPDNTNFFASVGRAEDYPLFQRAWCFQERILASRILHCSQSEYVFEYGNGVICEDGCLNDKVGQIHLKSRYGHILRHNSKGVKARAGSEVMECWISLIADYTSKYFTYVKDTLPALSGLASRMPRDLCGSYLAGLWEHNLGR